jgi:hybrid polyketide synthase/nonribosomal peptide synthetase ACE1
MDPQQRMLMEVVYDSLCAAGQPMDKLHGSDTAVYVGMMSDDWNTMVTRDYETLPRYTATGLERGIMANRISFFYGWHGPSMTLDTACSSSLVALDLAVQIVRSGKSKMAVAAGANLILSPGEFLALSHRLQTLWTMAYFLSHVYIGKQPRNAVSQRSVCHVGLSCGWICAW